ncbi:MAG: type II toxin-antitoxin system VapC family toxin [Akkermansiaceae bacterium]|nr:type II toxin-antitoxin system VapC family toxin [Akkermansiaceae bacterium]
MVQIARQTATRQWWDEGCSGFDLFTSQEVIDEAGRGDPEQASRRLEILAEIPVLELNSEVENLARRLIAAGLVPASVASDAVHIATASVHAVDFLITWNFKHIANPIIRQRLRQEVALSGYALPVLCTPEELLSDEND